jgi:ATP-binding cassette, subfamily C (CFTR/MRP), member 4
LLSNDFSKFDIALCFVHDVWKGPFETLLLGFLIYREIGIAGVVGIVFILSFIPIQSFIGKKAAHFRSQTTKRTDVRVRLMNEIINGIQVIKMYSWQENFSKVIEKVRKREVAAVKGSNYILALLYCLWAVSRVSLFLTLITYVYSGNVLNARKVFIVTAFYNILNMSMVHFWPLSITFCAEGYISSKRLKEFLLQPENKKPAKLIDLKNDVKTLDAHRIHHETRPIDNTNAIIFKDFTAIWTNVSDENANGLRNINYTFEHGKTYAIIGPVGKYDF